MLAFDPNDRPSAKEALEDLYFRHLARVEREPSTQPVIKMEFEFERRRITKDDVQELIYREILEYHLKMLKEYLEGAEPTSFMYPSVVDKFKKQFAFLEERYLLKFRQVSKRSFKAWKIIGPMLRYNTCGAPPEPSTRQQMSEKQQETLASHPTIERYWKNREKAW
ncbi:mitogen-activated protein kinase 16 [Striga asiatica]|uniref:Mitogen-activated protein kinase 16 n=1 Tax=Striga asiatica TaxID=4170 RepID=A0A5A7QFQ0_STRAF|nr:mitogen-activated protein kinase 16 [Striga asiatica]